MPFFLKDCFLEKLGLHTHTHMHMHTHTQRLTLYLLSSSMHSLWLPPSPTTVMRSSELPDFHQRDQCNPFVYISCTLSSIFYFFKLLIYLGRSVMVLAWESENSLQESVLSYTECQTQVIGLCGKHLYLPTHFSGSLFSFVYPVYICLSIHCYTVLSVPCPFSVLGLIVSLFSPSRCLFFSCCREKYVSPL